MINRLKKLVRLPCLYSAYFKDWRNYKKLADRKTTARFSLKWSDRIPAIWENSTTTKFDAHYVYHNAWAIRKVLSIAPEKHVDISSTVYFCTSLSASMPVEFYDYRPADISLSGLECSFEDLTKLTFDTDSIVSLSCMHTVEHIGLGRYGDEIDVDGDLKAFSELKRVVSPGGYLLIVLPVGRAKICFNAHRIYSFKQVLAIFSGFTIEEHSLVTDSGQFIVDASESEFDNQNYGCGCFLLRKANQSH